MPTDEVYILIDNGTSSMKAGLSTSNYPKIIPTCIGYPKYKKMMGYFDMSKYFTDKEIRIGSSALNNRAVLKITYPIEKGIVNNWDDIEKIFGHVFTNELRVLSEEHNIMLTEKINVPNQIKCS